jgi:hypothetical protein
MPRSRKHNYKKVKKNKTKKIVGGANLSNPNIGFIMVDHIDPMSSLRIDLTDLTPFYKHFELLQEPSLFDENFQEKLDKSYKNLGKQVSRMMGEVSEKTPETPQITSSSDEDVSVLNIDFFGNAAEAIEISGRTIQYEIINRDKKTIDFLMIVQKFKLLQYFCVNQNMKSNNKNYLQEVEQAVADKNTNVNFKKDIESGTDKKFYLITGLIDFLNEVFKAIAEALDPKMDDTKGIHPFSLSWNEDEITVLQEYQTQSNTIYGILVKFLYNNIELTINSEFISSPKQSSILGSTEAITDDESVAETKIKLIMSKGTDDVKKIIEELIKTMNDKFDNAINSAVDNMSDAEFQDFINNPQVSEYVKTNKQKYQTNYWINIAKDIDDKKQKNAGELVQLASRPQ